MLASSQGGINIEEVARDDPDSILTEPVDIDVGISEEQARKVAVFMGFEGDKVDQVSVEHVTSLLLLCYEEGGLVENHMWPIEYTNINDRE